MTTAEAAILAVVEGLTEFLPVSSTGHMIIAEGLLRMQKSTLTEVYIINIQFGAILAVVVLYWKRFFQSTEFYLKLFAAFLPAAIIGLALHKYIDQLLSSVLTVAISLVVGGVALVLVDKIFHEQIENVPDDEDKVKVKVMDEFGMERVREVQQVGVSYKQAVIIGFCQTLGMIPGISRSAVTIIGGLTQKFSIKKAAEFSFFLAVPTIFAAAGYKLWKEYDLIKGTDIGYLIMGNIVSFIVGLLAIRFFISLITHFGLKFFGYYRIVVGLIIIILIAMGHKLEITG